MILKHGVFTVSLDFELYWGVRDKRSIEQYSSNLLGARKAIPEILSVFDDSGIHATWATVGFLFFDNIDELNANTPELLPTYNNTDLSPYKYINETSNIESPYHFAPEIIDLILKYNGQEIGTHTLSHYYCLEEGQTANQFEEDLFVATKIAAKKGVSLKSIIFPRNQWNDKYLPILSKFGILCYRGNEQSWIYKASGAESENKIKRAFRLIDSYINISGHNTYELEYSIKNQPFNFPSSRFLRPYSSRLAILENLRLNRIKNSMSYAARNNRIFHLWWHPHNFGVNTARNIEFLKEIANHYHILNKKYGMTSINMHELCQLTQ